MQYLFLKRKIKATKPSSITVDIFDTLLLRGVIQEKWRFYRVSRRLVKALDKYNIHVSTYLLWQMRLMYFGSVRQSNIWHGYDGEASYKQVFTLMLEDILKRNNVKKSKKMIGEIVEKLYWVELNYELGVLKPNKRLLLVLKKAKAGGAQLYFVSDMYFTSIELATLLSKKKIAIFKSSISSADTMLGKSSGRVFEELSKQQPGYIPTQSLHIGDMRQADVATPKRFGVQTFWLFLPLHRIKLKLGRLASIVAISLIQLKQHYALRKSQSAHMRTLYTKHAMRTDKEARFLGTIFAPAIIDYITRLGIYATLHTTQPVFLSSEAEVLAKLYNKLGYGKSKKLVHFNRTLLLHSYCAILYKNGASLGDLVEVAKKISRRKTTSEALKLLGVTQIDDTSSLYLPKSTFSKRSLDAINIADTVKFWNSQLSVVKKSWKTSVGKRKGGNVLIADIGWNDTLQLLLTEILKHIDSSPPKLVGLYLGRTNSNIFHPKLTVQAYGTLFDSLSEKQAKYLYQPELWESFINSDNKDSASRDNILQGIYETIDYYKTSGHSSQSFLKLNRSTLYRFTKRPPKRAIEVLAALKFDYGTAEESDVALIDTSVKKLKLYKWLVFDRKQLKAFYYGHGWKWGAATYYHFRIVYRLWRRVSKKPSF